MTNLSSVAVVIIGSVDAGSFDRSRVALPANDWPSIDALGSWDAALDGTVQHAKIAGGELDGFACIPTELLAGPSSWALVGQP